MAPTSRVLVVGAGFAGAVYARCLAEAGHDVEVIDKRGHIAGNCFDYVDPCGVRVHRYGPHLFHTSNAGVVEWLSRFTGWVPYEHRVQAVLPDGRMAPFPINIDTINIVFGTALRSEAEVADFLKTVTVPCAAPANAEEWLFANVGPRLTALFFAPYTLKMWQQELREVSADVVKRVRLRLDHDDRYFPGDAYQCMPDQGYTALFERIFDHPRIGVRLETGFRHEMLERFTFCFNSMPIDEFFGFELGELPYRSIRFHLRYVDAAQAPAGVTMNYTDTGAFTRETWWANIPNHRVRETGQVCVTVEEPCDYKDNFRERYYPLKTSDGRYDALYRRYQERAAGLGGVEFIGRCGTYQYLDMHQVINQSLMGVRRWLERG